HRRQARGRARRRAGGGVRLGAARHRRRLRRRRGGAAARDRRQRNARRTRRDRARGRLHPPDDEVGRSRGRAAMNRFSFNRWWGIVSKEFVQLRRDRITFGMIVGIPIVQLLLFGYAINTEPKHLPTAVVVAEQSEFTRSYLAAMRASGYFDFVEELSSEQ